jgi:carboxymethylenebutenolidase
LTNVIEQELDVRTRDGVADAVLYRDGHDRRLPGVLQLTDIGGIRSATREMARRLAAAGYTVLMPNAFYRTRRSPLFDFARTPGDAASMKRFGELSAPLTREAMERDGADYVDFLASHPAVSAGAMAVVGYCFTGSMALRTAAVRPDRIAAAASFHGGGLATDTPASPHLLLPRIKARLYIGHAVNDRSMPAEAIETLDQALTAWGGRYKSEVYDAHHSWTVSDSPVYNEAQANRAFDALTTLLAETLG